ncbi:ATP-grasp fold amidoligase family protein [Pseudokineococcus sp. 1T1Z-3]|uniref:ATP-grasp fold amidoligase family protein n=1 Tax=Pseudokineococcus sp. 1T1Z-3 TaxID=3132745 RepID=UPI0030AE4458
MATEPGLERRPPHEVSGPGPATRPPHLLAALSRTIWRSLPVAARRSLRHRQVYGRFPRRDPRTFNEKVHWRMLHDRRPRLVTACDKLAAKELAVAAGVLPARTLWTGTDVADLADAHRAGLDLGERWVLKPNHRGGGLVHLGAGRPDPARLAELARGWLDPSSDELRMGEWAYSRARRLLLVEERLGAPEEVLTDYKVHVVGGEPALVQVHHGRFGDHRLRYYRPDWTPTDVTVRGAAPAPLEPAPDRLAELLDAAARLGRTWDYVRVDLYLVPEGVRFGELTVYPGSGLTDFTRDAWLDRELGARWVLPHDAVAASTASPRRG